MGGNNSFLNCTCSLMILIILGLLKAGRIADYIPTNIIKGLLAAIGLILIFSQLPYALGVELDKSRLLNLEATDNLDPHKKT